VRMPFTFELTFTGLCVFIYKGADSTKPSAVSVVLTKASHHSGHHKHLPFLSYMPKDLASGSTSQLHHRLVPSPAGHDIALLALAGAIEVDDPTAIGFSASWAKSGQEPAPGEETSLSWLPPLYEINKTEVPKPDLNKPNHGLSAEVATITLKGGTLEAGDLTRAVDGKYVLAEFVYEDGTGSDSDDTQVLAGSLRLKITGLTSPVKITGPGWEAWLRPAPLPGNSGGTGRVEVSITNLPEVPDPGFSHRLVHFDHFYDMFSWNPPRPEFRLPKLLGDAVTGSSAVCPPTRYDG
jgi:hypothetical protein